MNRFKQIGAASILVAGLCVVSTARSDEPTANEKKLAQQVEELKRENSRLRVEMEAMRVQMQKDSDVGKALANKYQQEMRMLTEAYAKARDAAKRQFEELAKTDAFNTERLKKIRDAMDQLFKDLGDRNLPDEPKVEEKRKQLLDEALKRYKEFESRETPNPDVTAKKTELELARTHLQLGRVNQQLGKMAEAEASYRKGIEMIRKLVANHPNLPEYRSELVNAYSATGEWLKSVGRNKEADEMLETAKAIQQSLLKDAPIKPKK